MPPPPPHPIFNTTWSTFTLPALYNLPLSARSLNPHSQRFLQLLHGQNTRSIPLPSTTTTATTTRSGTLQSCLWELLPAPYPGIIITLTYEQATYSSLLLSDGGRSKSGFTRVPLLLSRFPGEIRGVLLEYLATNFDTLPLGLGFSEGVLRGCLEGYVAGTGGGGKDVALVFAGRAEGLRRISVTLSGEDVAGFWERRDGGRFLDVLGRHLEDVMGLRIDEVELVKVASGGFVMAVEGKVKFFEGGGEAVIEAVLQEAAKSLLYLESKGSEQYST
ncbi:kinetochore complex Sim4 subunit Fta1-domain-containing protein [Pyronema omphalodes]|nr:kinetochore complex Sim4 subunit Fta1-domain-containing protein [Pyronema omphalodes]